MFYIKYLDMYIFITNDIELFDPGKSKISKSLNYHKYCQAQSPNPESQVFDSKICTLANNKIKGGQQPTH